MLVELSDIVGSLSLSDLNKVLYRCNEEESDQGFGGGVYVVPTTGAMVYCGLQGMMNLVWLQGFPTQRNMFTFFCSLDMVNAKYLASDFFQA